MKKRNALVAFTIGCLLALFLSVGLSAQGQDQSSPVWPEIPPGPSPGCAPCHQ